MHKLTVVFGFPMLHELMRRLEEASIDANYAKEHNIGEVYLAGPRSVSVWIADENELRQARTILRDVLAQRSRVRCPSCDYDLRGHAGTTKCPECGRDLTAQFPDRQCPHCQEAVPEHFELCWNCGNDLRSTNDRNA